MSSILLSTQLTVQVPQLNICSLGENDPPQEAYNYLSPLDPKKRSPRSENLKRRQELKDKFKEIGSLVNEASAEGLKRKKITPISKKLSQIEFPHAHLFIPYHESTFTSPSETHVLDTVIPPSPDIQKFSHYCFSSFQDFQKRAMNINDTAYGLVKGAEKDKIYLIRSAPSHIIDDNVFKSSDLDFISFDILQDEETSPSTPEDTTHSVQTLFDRLNIQEKERPTYSFHLMPIDITLLSDNTIAFKHASLRRAKDFETHCSFTLFRTQVEQRLGITILKSGN